MVSLPGGSPMNVAQLKALLANYEDTDEVLVVGPRGSCKLIEVVDRADLPADARRLADPDDNLGAPDAPCLMVYPDEPLGAGGYRRVRSPEWRHWNANRPELS